jgi:hypothetical protein
LDHGGGNRRQSNNGMLANPFHDGQYHFATFELVQHLTSNVSLKGPQCLPEH